MTNSSILLRFVHFHEATENLFRFLNEVQWNLNAMQPNEIRECKWASAEQCLTRHTNKQETQVQGRMKLNAAELWNVVIRNGFNRFILLAAVLVSWKYCWLFARMQPRKCYIVCCVQCALVYGESNMILQNRISTEHMLNALVILWSVCLYGVPCIR